MSGALKSAEVLKFVCKSALKPTFLVKTHFFLILHNPRRARLVANTVQNVLLENYTCSYLKSLGGPQAEPERLS